MQASAAMATFTADPELAWAQVVSMLRSEDVWTRASGSYLAAKLPHPDSEVLLLETLLKEEDPALVLRSLSWFGKCGTAACVANLELLSRLGDPRYRATAQASLKKVKKRIASASPAQRGPATPDLESSLNSHDTLHGARSRKEIAALVAAAKASAADAQTLESTAPEMGASTLEDLAEKANAPAPESESPSANPKEKSPTPSKAFAGIGVALLVLVGAWGGGRFWKESPPEPPPTPSVPAVIAPPITVLHEKNGRIDMNRQPRAGKEGRWVGKVIKYAERSLVLSTESGFDLPLEFQKKLALEAWKGKQVLVSGKVFKKGRQSISLMPGATVQAYTPDPEE